MLAVGCTDNSTEYQEGNAKPANMDCVCESLINSEKTSTSPVFKKNVERFLCLSFSITHTHHPIMDIR